MTYICTRCKITRSPEASADWRTTLLWCPKCKTTTQWAEQDESEIRHGSQTFYKLLEESAAIHDKKNHDYATNKDPFGNYRFAGELSKLFSNPTDAGLIGRFGEKLFRLSNLETKEDAVVKNESIDDTEIDLLTIIGLFVANRKDRRNASNS